MAKTLFTLFVIQQVICFTLNERKCFVTLIQQKNQHILSTAVLKHSFRNENQTRSLEINAKLCLNEGHTTSILSTLLTKYASRGTYNDDHSNSYFFNIPTTWHLFYVNWVFTFLSLLKQLNLCLDILSDTSEQSCEQTQHRKIEYHLRCFFKKI